MSSTLKTPCEQQIDLNEQEKSTSLKKRLRSSNQPDKMQSKRSKKAFEDDKPVEEESKLSAEQSCPNTGTEDHAKTDVSTNLDEPCASTSDGWPSERKSEDNQATLIDLEEPDEPASWNFPSDLSRKEKKLRKHYWDELPNNMMTWREVQAFMFDDDMENEIKIGILESELRYAHSRITDYKIEIGKRNCLIDHWRNEMESLRDKVDELEQKLAGNRANQE